MLLKNKRFSADGQNTAQESCGDNASPGLQSAPKRRSETILLVQFLYFDQSIYFDGSIHLHQSFSSTY